MNKQLPSDECQRFIDQFKVGQTLSHDQAMALASAKALCGAGAVKTNPMVGCVIMSPEHRLLGLGCHEQYGGPHAEINALKTLSEQELKGATLYSTLEPCSHQGKTPSCAKHIRDLPIQKVIIGHRDPNPVVDGRGASIITEAGIEVEFDDDFRKMSEESLEAYKFFAINHKPFVALKAAISLDGRSGYTGAQRHWLTGSRARRYGHWLRQKYDAILVGAGTVQDDNPTLDVRLERDIVSNPMRVVLDPKGRALRSRPIAEHKILFQPKSTVWVVGESQIETSEVQNIRDLGVHVIACSEPFASQNIVDALKPFSITSLLLEGGPKVWSHWLNESSVQKAYLFQAPILLGSANTVGPGDGLQHREPLQLKNRQITELDEDILIEGRL